MKIIIADDNRGFREALSIFIETELGYKVISECDNGQELLENEHLSKADIILADIEMPVLNGIEAVKSILNDYTFLKAVAITGYHDKAYLYDLIANGFKGCVFKDSIYENLSEAMRLVRRGELYFPDNILLKDITEERNI